MRICLLLLVLAAPAHANPPSLLDAVPDSALLGGALRANALELFKSYFTQTPDMQRDLGAYFVKRLGFDVTRIDGAAFWAVQIGAQPSFGLFLRLPQQPQLKGAV